MHLTPLNWRSEVHYRCPSGQPQRRGSSPRRPDATSRTSKWPIM